MIRKSQSSFLECHSSTLKQANNTSRIPVWDDHEVADNTYRDGSADLNNTEASFILDGGVAVDQRKMNAVRAYYEWMPIR
jgi:alkaline phosphatase D